VTRYLTETICIFKSSFGETSQVVHWITPKLGRVACLVKGAYRAKNGYHGNEDLLNVSWVAFYRRRAGDLAVLRERRLVEHFAGLRHNSSRFAAALLVLETIRWSVQEGQHISGFYDLVKNTLLALERCGDERDMILFVYLGGLLRLIGFQPVLSSCVECGRVPEEGRKLFVSPRYGGIVCRHCRPHMQRGVVISATAGRLVRKTPHLDPLEMQGIELSETLRNELWTFFSLFLTHYLERELKSIALLREDASS